LDKTARVWNARTGQPLTEPLAHQESVMAASFSPDGARVVTASWDKTVRVWDARTGKPLTESFAHQGQVMAASFSPDGARIVTASYDKTARLWDLPLDTGSLDNWKRRARCGYFALQDGVLVDNHSPCP
jgi:WD40 repeat protein